uniref:Uncharacterized protein n=1 Tax=Rhizophora mucronata TaxID=61149 RepID=A0A2P2NR29_RHIMU
MSPFLVQNDPICSCQGNAEATPSQKPPQQDSSHFEHTN